MNQILKLLVGEDRRSIGHSDEVVQIILRQPEKFDELFQGLYELDPIIRMRTADAIEKITINKPNLLIPYKQKILDLINKVDQIEVQWHFAQIIPRLSLSTDEIDNSFRIIEGYLTSPSAIVKAFSLQCLFELTLQKPDLLPQTRKHLNKGLESSVKAVQSRSRMLLKEIEKYDRNKKPNQ